MSASKIRDIRVPVAKRSEKNLTVSPEHRAVVQQGIMLINHHRQLAATFEENMGELLLKEYGIDIFSGQWNLDMATGNITAKVATSPPQDAQQVEPLPLKRKRK